LGKDSQLPFAQLYTCSGTEARSNLLSQDGIHRRKVLVSAHARIPLLGGAAIGSHDAALKKYEKTYHTKIAY